LIDFGEQIHHVREFVVELDSDYQLPLKMRDYTMVNLMLGACPAKVQILF
jgi:hypothetical protein